MYGTKIRMVRELRGYSQDYVAEKLGIAQNSYSKIEANHTKLSADMLQKIAIVLEISPMDIMSQQPAIINLQPNQGTQQAFGYVETFVSSQKELVAQLIEAKDAEINRLQKMVDDFIAGKS